MYRSTSGGGGGGGGIDPSDHEAIVAVAPVPMPMPVVAVQQQHRYSTRRRDPRPEVEAYTVQCSRCRQWRIVPGEDVYESIRAKVLEQPWVCDDARAWRPDASCEVEGDLEVDGGGGGGESLLWAMDKPNLPVTPPGWKRELVIRSQGCVRFGDIYYRSPCGTKLRSMVEVAKFLADNPHYRLTISQFSFAIPQPVDPTYVAPRKRARSMDLSKLLLNRAVRRARRSAAAKPDGEIRFPPPVPQGWIREIVVRGRGSRRLCDVYYLSPCQARLRSLPEMNEFLHHVPGYLERGITLDDFDFTSPSSEREMRTVGSLPGCALTFAARGSALDQLPLLLTD